MRLVQLNIWQGRIMTHLLKLFDDLQPDIACLQEVMSSSEVVVTPERMFNSLQLIQERIDLKYVYFSPTFRATYSGVTTEFGNAILSRYPLDDCQTVFTNGSFIPDYTPKTFSVNVRNMQIVKVKVAEQVLNLANHHGHWLIDPFGDETTIAKLQIVKDVLKTVPSPLILSGDFNVRAESPAMRLFDGWLTDLTATHQIGSTLSPLAKVSSVACDHILTSPGVQVMNFEVRDEIVSDHKAIVLDFELK